MSRCHLFTVFSNFKQGAQRLLRGTTFVSGDPTDKVQGWWRRTGVWGHSRGLRPPLPLTQLSESQGRCDLIYSSSHWWGSWNKGPSGSISGKSFLICLLQHRAKKQGQPILPKAGDPGKQNRREKDVAMLCFQCSECWHIHPAQQRRGQMTTKLSPITRLILYPSPKGSSK